MLNQSNIEDPIRIDKIKAKSGSGLSLVDDNDSGILINSNEIRVGFRVNEKCRRHGDRIVEQNTAYNPKKLSKTEKDLIIKDLILETAKERTDRLE